MSIFDIRSDPSYPYQPFYSARPAAETPGALARYNAVYDPYEGPGGMGGDPRGLQSTGTPENPATTQSFGDMLRDTIAIGRDLIGGPGWGSAIGTGLSMATGMPGLGSILGLGERALDISQGAREGDAARAGIGSRAPSQQGLGALAQASAMGMASDWGGFGPGGSDSKGDMGGKGGGDVSASTGYGGDKGDVSGSTGWGGDKFARGGHILGALRRARVPL